MLDVSYPVVNSGGHYFPAAALATVLSHSGGTASYSVSTEQLQAAIDLLTPAEAVDIPHPNLTTWRTLLEVAATPAFGGERQLVAAFIGSLEDSPTDAIDAYLRLHLLSHRSVQPLGMNMGGIFGVLSNVVWTNLGPFEVEGFEAQRLRLKAKGHQVQVHLIDKFPRMLDYVVPTGVRIADANRVRLGAHLAEGTTVMHEGFVTSMREPSVRRWLKDESRLVCWLGTAQMLVVEPRSWAPCLAAAKSQFVLGKTACWVPTLVSVSPWVIAASSKPGCI